MGRRRPLALVLAVAVVLLGSCGDDDDSAPPTSSPAPTAEGAPTTDDRALCRELETQARTTGAGPLPPDVIERNRRLLRERADGADDVALRAAAQVFTALVASGANPTQAAEALVKAMDRCAALGIPVAPPASG